MRRQLSTLVLIALATNLVAQPTITSAPELTNPPDGAVGTSLTPELRWEPVEGAAKYDVQVGPEAGFSDPIIFTDKDGTDFGIGQDRLQSGTTYYWRIRGRNGTSRGPWSATWSFTPGSTGTTAIPVLLSPADNATSVPNSLLLQWEESSNASSYDLMVAEESSFSDPTASRTQEGTEFEFVSPSVESEFYWRVRANGPDGTSAWSETRIFMTGLEGPLVAHPVAPTDRAADVPRDVETVWMDAPAAAAYRLQVADELEFESTAPGKAASIIVDRDGLVDTTFLVQGLEPSKTYYWRVAGVDTLSRFTFGPVRSFATSGFDPGAPPGPADLLRPEEGSTGEPAFTEFEWEPVAGAARYHIEVDEDVRFPAPVINDSMILEASYTASEPLAYSTRYFWRVRAHNAAGFGPWSHTFAFTTAVGTPIEYAGTDIPAEYALHRNFPNPFNPGTVISFDLPEAAEATIRVYDVTGRRVAQILNARLSAGRYEARFDAGNLPNGVYLYRLETTSYSQTRSLVVAR